MNTVIESEEGIGTVFNICLPLEGIPETLKHASEIETE